MSAIPVVSALGCRRLLMSAQGLCDDPSRKVTIDLLYDMIVRMGFVQIDSINVLERAHHLTLFSRFDHYERDMLKHLLEQDRRLFENWTHDASLIPTMWFNLWQHRFKRREQRVHRSAWWRERLGPDPDKVVADVLARVERHGPVSSSDFETPERSKEDSAWWGWKPQKAALEHLWRCGRLAVVSRHNFQKKYDLTERVLPAAAQLPVLTEKQYIDWMCDSALQRLGVATATEIASFWRSVSIAEARSWCENAVKAQRAVKVMAGSRACVAVPDWPQRLELAQAPRRMRLLCPFDPIIRDRDRLERVFGFTYRFEAFTPSAQRQHGYYVLPILEGEDLVGRLDAKTHRTLKTLEVHGVWWEPGVKPGPRRTKALGVALERLTAFVGADRHTGVYSQ